MHTKAEFHERDFIPASGYKEMYILYDSAWNHPTNISKRRKIWIKSSRGMRMEGSKHNHRIFPQTKWIRSKGEWWSIPSIYQIHTIEKNKLKNNIKNNKKEKCFLLIQCLNPQSMATKPFQKSHKSMVKMQRQNPYSNRNKGLKQ